jgi:hypothetical protein
MDLTKMKAPDGPVTGMVFGADFKPRVQLQNTGLDLQSGRDLIHIFLTIKPGQDTYEFSADGPQRPAPPHIHIHILSTDPPGMRVYTSGYAMRVEFGKEKEGKIPGKIYLCLPDDRGSCIAGSFELKSD